jgi:glutaredoxin-dependent peroxiredoxin
MPVEIGEPAPPFALPLKPGEAPLQLADYLGERPLVLLFFPLAFSSVCTEEMFRVAEHLAAWDQVDAQVLAVSVDSPFVTQRFAGACGADFPILSDFNREAARAYGVLNEDYYGLKGVANRAAFVIDRKGRIVYRWESRDGTALPDFEAIGEALKQAEG